MSGSRRVLGPALKKAHPLEQSNENRSLKVMH
jgi:hypothetical protein